MMLLHRNYLVYIISGKQQDINASYGGRIWRIIWNCRYLQGGNAEVAFLDIEQGI